MFLLRLAFWLAILVFLLPTDPQQQARLRTTAIAVLERTTGFCDRNAKTCAVGAEVWANFVRKAEFALRLIGDLLGGPPTRDERPPPGRHGAGVTDPPDTPLQPDLYRPPWPGPPADR